MKNLLFSAALAAAALAGACSFPEQARSFGADPVTLEGFHAPWDGLDDETVFIARVSADSLFFHFSVKDSTMTVSADFPQERTVDWEDRAEIFLSVDDGMSSYWCAEIDPLGRVMDYAAHLGQPFDYGWNFSSLVASGQVTPDGYEVDGRVALQELRELGIPLEGFSMGLFRADFHPDMSVNWYSFVSTDDETPYFHKPNVLFPITFKIPDQGQK